MPPHNSDELLRQFHHNQSMWVARLATGEIQPDLPHSRLLRTGNTLAMRPGTAGVIMLPMDGDVETTFGEHSRALRWLQDHNARDVLVWNMEPNPQIDLALLAQGYAGSFEPWWMTRSITAPIPPPKHRVRSANPLDIQVLLESDIPYVIRDQVPANRSLINAKGEPQVMWLVAIEHDDVVGHAIVNLVSDHAGLFNVGVSPKHRFRGIGTSLTLAAMQAARNHGATTMNLNSTPAGKKLYERLGFRQFGTGQTWVKTGKHVHQVPSHSEQQLIHAIGLGDTHSIRITPAQRPYLQCRMSPQELAAHFGQQESLLEIILQGSIPEIVSLWKVGLRDEAIKAASDPGARELLSGTMRAHPIHHAVEMGAGSLVIALIAAGANLNARDAEYNATPLDWAHATNKPTIARIIRQAGGK